MTWEQTHQRWRIVQELDEEAARAAAAGRRPRLAWRPEWAGVFGGRDQLQQFLRARRAQAQQVRSEDTSG